MKANECLVLLTETASCSPSIHRGVAAVLHHLASTPPNASSISAPVIWRKMGGGKGSCKEWKVQGEEREGGEEEREGRRRGRGGRAHEITTSYNLNYNNYLFEPCKKLVQIFFVHLLIS